jgi:hypothetical protein
MDILNDQPSGSQLKTKSPLLGVVLGILGIAIFTFVGYVAGVASSAGCNKSVLGVQTSNSIASRLALLLNIEKPSQDIQIFQLAPTNQPEPTEEPTPSDPNDTPSMIWSGINRNPKPTSTPSPNNYITTPEPTVDPQAPTPTPQYKVNWDRNNHTPTPPPNNVIIEATAESTKTGEVQSPKKVSIIPLEIQKMIDETGMQMDNLEIARSEGEQGTHISGQLHERLFGFLTVGYPISFKVDQDMGTIESASIPWWRSLFGNPFVGNISKIRCGDGICSSTESLESCKTDCEKVCGNGICEFGEGTDTCSQDCTIPN